jgi:hypothetical protein
VRAGSLGWERTRSAFIDSTWGRFGFLERSLNSAGALAINEVHSESSTTAERRRSCSCSAIILLVVGFVTGISILWTIGIILAVIGAILWIMGSLGHAVAGRRHYW